MYVCVGVLCKMYDVLTRSTKYFINFFSSNQIHLNVSKEKPRPLTGYSFLSVVSSSDHFPPDWQYLQVQRFWGPQLPFSASRVGIGTASEVTAGPGHLDRVWWETVVAMELQDKKQVSSFFGSLVNIDKPEWTEMRMCSLYT